MGHKKGATMYRLVNTNIISIKLNFNVLTDNSIFITV